EPTMTNSNRNRRRRGNGAIEFALGFSMLWACFAGAFQYGYSMWIYNSLQTAVTDGATYASRATYCGTRTDFATQTKNMVIYGKPNPSGGDAPVIPILSDVSKVSVTTTPATFPDTVTVRIVNFTVNAGFQSFTFSNKPAVTMVYLGNYQAGSC